jgi:hypothetical protein
VTVYGKTPPNVTVYGKNPPNVTVYGKTLPKLPGKIRRKSEKVLKKEDFLAISDRSHDQSLKSKQQFCCICITVALGGNLS